MIWPWLALQSLEEGHDLASHLKDHNLNTFSILMCAFSCMTLGEFQEIDVYFKSHSQQLTFDSLYKEVIFLTAVS